MNLELILEKATPPKKGAVSTSPTLTRQTIEDRAVRRRFLQRSDAGILQWPRTAFFGVVVLCLG